jgi:hypothetical protein
MAPDADARREDDDNPSVRQLLHAATGDREAEAKALADRADGAVSEDDAELAVKRAHGDQAGQPSADRDVATPEDAEAVAESKD